MCLDCIIGVFERGQARGVPWSECPECGDVISAPPKRDPKVEMAVFWLQLALGDQPSDPPFIPPAVSPHVFDLYPFPIDGQ